MEKLHCTPEEAGRRLSSKAITELAAYYEWEAQERKRLAPAK